MINVITRAASDTRAILRVGGGNRDNGAAYRHGGETAAAIPVLRALLDRPHSNRPTAAVSPDACRAASWFPRYFARRLTSHFRACVSKRDRSGGDDAAPARARMARRRRAIWAAGRSLSAGQSTTVTASAARSITPDHPDSSSTTAAAEGGTAALWGAGLRYTAVTPTLIGGTRFPVRRDLPWERFVRTRISLRKNLC